MRQIDAKGKRRLDLSGRGVLFRDYLIGHPGATDAEAARAIGGASTAAIRGWKLHPQFSSVVYMAEKRTEEAIKSRAEWFGDVVTDREFAQKHKNPSAAHDATKTYGRAAGYLDAEQKPGGGDTYNFNGPNPLIVAGLSLEEIRAWTRERSARLVEGKVDHTDGS